MGFGFQFFEESGGVALVELEREFQCFGPPAEFIGGEVPSRFRPGMGQAAEVVGPTLQEVLTQESEGGAMGGAEGIQGGSQICVRLGIGQPSLQFGQLDSRQRWGWGWGRRDQVQLLFGGAFLCGAAATGWTGRGGGGLRSGWLDGRGCRRKEGFLGGVGKGCFPGWM